MAVLDIAHRASFARRTLPMFSVTGGDVAPRRLEILNGMEAIVVGQMTSMNSHHENSRALCHGIEFPRVRPYR